MKRILHHCFFRCRGERGNTMIEFAVAFTFMSALFIGVFQFGYSFYMYNVLSTGIRGGARYAAQKKYVPASTSTRTSPVIHDCFQTGVKNMVVYGTPAPAENASPVVPGLTRSNVQVVGTYDSAGVPDEITVRISRTAPFRLNALFRTMSFAGKPSVTFPYTGVYAPNAISCLQ